MVRHRSVLAFFINIPRLSISRSSGRSLQMAINKFMRLALKLLSYPDIDIRKTYHIKRTLKNITLPDGLNHDNRWRDCIISANDHEILTRVYSPKVNSGRGTLLFFHGGGWVTESVKTYHRVCYSLANHTGCHVVSVDYRLAPENPFPNGLNDCYTAAQFLFSSPEIFGLTPDKITLIGDSAGGNLAAAVSLMAHDSGVFSVPRQILIYPATYNNHSESSPFPSVIENGKDYLLTSKHVSEYISLYKRNDDDLYNPYFAPLLAEDLTGQPDTLIITAEYDPLRDEGEAYAHRLRKFGNNVTVHRMKDALHGFLALGPGYVHVKRTYKLINSFLDNNGQINN